MADQIRKADPPAPIDIDALPSPEGPYMRSNGHEDSAQLVDQLEWAQSRAIQRDRVLRDRPEGQGKATIEGGLA